MTKMFAVSRELIRLSLICDGCPNEFELEGLRVASSIVKRERAAQSGWIVINGKDYCPTCQMSGRVFPKAHRGHA